MAQFSKQFHLFFVSILLMCLSGFVQGLVHKSVHSTRSLHTPQAIGPTILAAVSAQATSAILSSPTTQAPTTKAPKNTRTTTPASLGPKDPKCLQPLEPGPCRMSLERYYFNAQTNTCETFKFGGCRGNDNKFGFRQTCEDACVRPQTTAAVPETPIK